ncbi:MAG: restriction endonuclease [Phycisphaerales bacterium]
MAVPEYQEFMLPWLKAAADRKELSVAEATDVLADLFKLSAEDRTTLLPSATQTRLRNRVQWAAYYLFRSGLLERVSRGRYRVTPSGAKVLASNPENVDNAFLQQFEGYRDFVAVRGATPAKSDAPDAIVSSIESTVTPDERLDAAYKELRATLADDVLERVRASSPAFFEHLVVDVLVAMGYGGSYADAARVVGRSGDGGIDGVIPEDRLGLDMVYVQAKKWENSVGPDEIRKFVGSLGEQKAHKGVFITSGTYTSGAKTAAEKASAKVVLIDGKQLAELMIDHGVGVAESKKYVVKKLDTDYFEGL